MTPINWLAIWFLASVVAAPFVGQWLHKRRTRNEFLAILALNKRLVDRERDARIERLARRLWLADNVIEQDKQRRKAASLGFTEEAFMLDDENQPRPAA